MKTFERIWKFIDERPKRTVASAFKFLAVALLAIIIVVSAILNRADKAEADFLSHWNFKVTMVIEKINRTDNHGYGVVFGKILNSNRPEPYTANYKDQYPLVRMSSTHILLVTYCLLMHEGDTVTLDSSKPEYFIKRGGSPVIKDPFTITTDFFLYREIEKNKYMDFSSY